MDCSGELADGGIAASCLSGDVPGLELGVGALVGGAQARVGAAGLLLGVQGLPALALLVREAGDAAGAREQYAAVLPICWRVLGAEHPGTLADLNGVTRWIGKARDGG
jgi:hypothetical protein